MQHSGTKRKQVEQEIPDADSCSYASSAACSAMTPCKTDRDQTSDECCKRSATEVSSPLLDVARQQDQLDQGLKYLEDILRVDTYQRPVYHRGTSIPVEGWIQPCNGCRSWTASSVTINNDNELPLCRRCFDQIVSLQRAQAQQRSEFAASEAPAAMAAAENNMHTYEQPAASIPHPDFTVPKASQGKLRRWSEADMECRATSSQDSHSSVACAQSSGCTSKDFGSRILHNSSQSYDSTRQNQHLVKSGNGCTLKRRAVCVTP